MKALITSLAIVVAFASVIRAQESLPIPSVSEATATVAEIPSGYEICENEPSHRRVAGLENSEEYEKTISPDGRFALLCPVHRKRL